MCVFLSIFLMLLFVVNSEAYTRYERIKRPLMNYRYLAYVSTLKSISKNSDTPSLMYTLSEELEIHIKERVIPAKLNAKEDFKNSNFSGIDDKILTFPYEKIL